MKTAIAIRHLAFEDLGVLQAPLESSDYHTEYLDIGVDVLENSAVMDADLVVVLGGPIGANDGDKYPAVDATIDLLRRRLDADRPTLGICLGAQLIARALGASVAPGAGPEIGYSPLTLTTAGQHSPLRFLDGVPVLHWHSDRFEVPRFGSLLASSAHCDHQAFSRGTNVLALQFHLEVPHTVIEQWLIGHAEALAAAQIDPRDIRQQAAKHGPTIERAAIRVATEWISNLESS